MITVTISINGSPILTRSATRIEEGKVLGAKYKLDSGEEIWHVPEEGAVELAKALLDCIDEKFIKMRKDKDGD